MTTKDILPQIFKSYFEINSDIHNYGTRMKSSLHVFARKSTSGQRCVRNKACSLWNKLPMEIKTKPTLAQFKNALHSYLQLTSDN